MLTLSLATLFVLVAWFLMEPSRPGRLILIVWTGMLCTAIPYCVLKVKPSGLENLCARLWFGLVVVWWVARDRRVRRLAVPFEYDAFMFAAWPVLLPHYLVRTRGRAGTVLSIWLYAPLVLLSVVYLLSRAIGPPK